MPREMIVPPSEIDPDNIVIPMDDVRKYNRQRFEMEQLTGLLRYDPEAGVCIGLRVVGDDEFWVRGHIPGRPLYPGVLMCECAAQTCSYYYMRKTEHDGFLGFAGLGDVKFRGQVVPGDRLVMVAACRELRARRAKFDCQGFVGEKLVFEGAVIGMPM